MLDAYVCSLPRERGIVFGVVHLRRDRADMPAGAERVLDRRSLMGSHRQLAALLRPGMSVLDVGCGTGAIIADVADAVGSQGLAVGADINGDR